MVPSLPLISCESLVYMKENTDRKNMYNFCKKNTNTFLNKYQELNHRCYRKLLQIFLTTNAKGKINFCI